MHTTASKGRMLYLFMKVTMYMRRGVQIMGWSVRMAFMACFTQ
ncbi:AABR07046713.2 [Phodopus roborovskii]|uniref:AABR07046713.2 protein n=1 Tax=Phodopus roborovskii TaxID=109678 RepID=A0AAU9YPG3_PHORO|nr:AABR07046713.2 [Phodopus roborovskii]